MTRPAPVTGRDNAYYWEGVAKGEVLIQKCTACGSLRHPPSPMCPECQSLNWTTAKATGRAVLHSYTICHHPLPPWEEGPYAVVLIDLEVEDTALEMEGTDLEMEDTALEVEDTALELEGSETRPRIVCGTRGIANEDLRIGMPLTLVFEDGLVFAGPEVAP